MIKAVIFGSIGTLVETSDIQRQSFNQAFKTLGIDWYWDKDNYKKLLKFRNIPFEADLFTWNDIE